MEISGVVRAINANVKFKHRKVDCNKGSINDYSMGKVNNIYIMTQENINRK